MNMSSLFNGIAVVIDDEIDIVDANIRQLINQLENQNVPLVKYNSIPDIDSIKHFQNLSYLLLDWRLIKADITAEDISEGITIPAGLAEYDASLNVDFIKNIFENCFCPIFIFTNEDIEEIKIILSEAQIYDVKRPNRIFIKSKAEAMEENGLSLSVEEWLKETPSMYVLKEWDREYYKSKNKLFSDMQSISPLWPCILWKTFDDDGAIQSLELGELISRNIYTRMTPFEFDKDRLIRDTSNVPKSELRKVLEGERFLTELFSENIGTGDVFKQYNEAEKKYFYFLNIRAQCDLARDSNPELYCLRGKEIDDVIAVERFDNGNGEFKDIVCTVCVPFIDEGKIVEFDFRLFKILKWNTLKEVRIGRLLPPYINRIQQRFSQYFQRQGVSRIPKGVFDCVVDHQLLDSAT